MLIRENQIFKNDTFSVSRMLFSSSNWENMTIIERLAYLQLSGIVTDRKLILTFNTLQFPLSEHEIIIPESCLIKYLGIDSQDIEKLLSGLVKSGVITFEAGTPEQFNAETSDLNLVTVEFPYTSLCEGEKFYKIILSNFLSSSKTAPSTPAIGSDKITAPTPVEMKITKPVPNKANDTKISIEQFSIGEYPEARADATEYMELYGLTLEQYEAALLKFCRMKSQSGYLHMNHFMFKCQFNLYIKKNLKHIIV